MDSQFAGQNAYPSYTSADAVTQAVNPLTSRVIDQLQRIEAQTNSALQTSQMLYDRIFGATPTAEGGNGKPPLQSVSNGAEMEIAVLLERIIQGGSRLCNLSSDLAQRI